MSRMASWTGVVDMFEMDRESRNGLRRSIGAHVLWIAWVENGITSGIEMSNWPGLAELEFSPWNKSW